MKELKIWNDSGWGTRIYDENKKLVLDPTGKRYCDHFYVCAESMAHALRLVNEVSGKHYTINNAKNYWSKGCWGNQMDGITPEVGVWTVQGYNDKPKKVI